jgi:hypothetical protein
MRRYGFVILVFIFVLLMANPLPAEEYFQVAGLIDLRTTFSDGALNPEELVQLARERGFEAVFINDHDRLAMEYGLFPFRGILKKRNELNSINKTGAGKYLDAIGKARQKYPGMIIIPGSETNPFYYWTGSYFKKTLTANDYERRILTIGMENPKDYEKLPVLHNNRALSHFKKHIPKLLPIFGSLLMGLILLVWKGFSRFLGIVIVVLSLVFLINMGPFRASSFDAYHGNQGIEPYQALIDYVNSRGGLTFWNYPETRSGVRKMGPIFLKTPPYPQVLQKSKNYTGFAALYGDEITITEPGGLWDQVLLEYCQGKRRKPAWAISTADFHRDGESGENLGNFPTIFLVKKRTAGEILFAMRQGRMYACLGRYPQRIILEEFHICSANCENSATLGQEITLTENPSIHISLALNIPTVNHVLIRLIRAGKPIKTFEGTLPMEIEYEDPYYMPGRKVYYRLDLRGKGTLISNPIFVSFR